MACSVLGGGLPTYHRRTCRSVPNHGAGTYNPPSLDELVSHMVQLGEFIAVMGAALHSVSELDITVGFSCGFMNKRQTQEHATISNPGNTAASSISSGSNSSGSISSIGSSGGSSGSDPDPACLDSEGVQALRLVSASGDLSPMSQLASLFVAACPSLRRLGVGGRVGEDLMRKFGRECPSMTTLELLDTNFWTGQFRGVSEDPMLPHVTHLIMTHSPFYSSPLLARIVKLLFTSNLTVLEVGSSWSGFSAERCALPVGLKTLH